MKAVPYKIRVTIHTCGGDLMILIPSKVLGTIRVNSTCGGSYVHVGGPYDTYSI